MTTFSLAYRQVLPALCNAEHFHRSNIILLAIFQFHICLRGRRKGGQIGNRPRRPWIYRQYHLHCHCFVSSLLVTLHFYQIPIAIPSDSRRDHHATFSKSILSLRSEPERTRPACNRTRTHTDRAIDDNNIEMNNLRAKQTQPQVSLHAPHLIPRGLNLQEVSM